MTGEGCGGSFRSNAQTKQMFKQTINIPNREVEREQAGDGHGCWGPGDLRAIDVDDTAAGECLKRTLRKVSITIYTWDDISILSHVKNSIDGSRQTTAHCPEPRVRARMSFYWQRDNADHDEPSWNWMLMIELMRLPPLLLRCLSIVLFI